MSAKKLTLLGSTGSIGTHCLALLEAHSGRFAVEALTAQNNAELLIAQAMRWKPARVVIGNEAAYGEVKDALAAMPIEVSAGEAAIEEVAGHKVDMVVAGIVGAAGLRPVLRALEAGSIVALANKEPLVCAGKLVMETAARCGSRILPVDSEHNAIFQVFAFGQVGQIEAITLTASGGPFRQFSLEQMRGVTPAQAVKHPKWSMGEKISVDSATLVNKGLEMIEASHLFPLRAEQIRVLVHPQSVVHGMVHYSDGSVLAQLGPSDMTVPLAHVLAWPERMSSPAPRLSLAEIGRLDFEEPDEQRFPGLALAREVMEAGGNAPIIFNAANESAVAQFLQGRIGFLDIVPVIRHSLQQVQAPAAHSLEDILAVDAMARRAALPTARTA